MDFPQFLKNKKFVLLSVGISLVGLFFLFSASPALAASCGKNQEEFSFSSFLNPLASLVEKVVKDFGYEIALAESPSTDPSTDPDFCGEDIIGCSGATSAAIISWVAAPSSYLEPGFTVPNPLSYYILTISGVGSWNTGLNTSYTVSGLANNSLYNWSVEAYYWRWGDTPSATYGFTNQPHGSFTTPSCCIPSCGGWSACSVSCGGGSQTQTCTNADCSTYVNSQSCNTQACVNNPKGWHDGSDCNSSVGWACDADDYNQALDIHFYRDGPFGSGGVFIGNVSAFQPREAAVGAACGGNPNHGFVFNTPDSLKDGISHSIYAYAINIGAAAPNPLLSGSPKTITCTCTLPTAPSLNSPANGSNLGTAPQTPTFSWADSAGEDRYYVDICTDSSCSSYTNKGPLAANTIQTTWSSSLSAGTYWWRVYAENSCGGVHSPIWSFTVSSPSSPPGNFNLNLGGTVTCNSVPLSWISSSGADAYRILRIAPRVDISPYQPYTALNFTDTTVSQNTSYIYQIEAYNAGGTNRSNALNVTTPYCPPTVSLSANPTSIYQGQTSTLSWSSTYATSCAASGGWSGSKALSGSQVVVPLPPPSATYNLTCSGLGGSDTKSVTINITALFLPDWIEITPR